MIWDASDANPMHRRLPAEVVSRRAYVKKSQVEEKAAEDQVIVDIRAASLLKPDARVKWLGKACKMVSDGRSTATDLYDVIVNRKFTSGLSDRVRRKLGGLVRESLDVFSDKQQRYLLSSESPLLVEASKEADDGALGDEDDDMDEEVAGPPESNRSSAVAPGPASGAAPPASSSTSAGPRAASNPASGLPFLQAELKVARNLSTKPPPVAGSGWQTVEDDSARRRNVAEEVRRDADKRAGKSRNVDAEENNVLARAAAEAAKKKKIEEEADDIFARIKLPSEQEAPAQPSGRNKERNRDRDRRRRPAARSRSDSISSREARKVKASEQKSRRSWQESTPIPALTGSRALLLNKDYQEDLPHLPRPTDMRGAGARVVQQARQAQGSASRSRSRG
eukprot:CAMPEP_0178403756 /NCGR_PEP_ID=MMETSP0689_2-20121128/17533_1 /TAXON_ID=160604 /ORGANISM="Amphidinium massartii, Strain CS-259" /LENGTH=393 /DNA_ID=CAMNT_0020024721 /DNA_START=57 /DNA_END=1234 /DNA_ORIENTATION=-